MVDQFFLHHVPSGRGKHQLGVQSRRIDSRSCVAHNPLDEFPAVELFFRIRDDGLEVIFDIVEFVLLGALEVDLLAGPLFAGLLGAEVEVLNGEHDDILLSNILHGTPPPTQEKLSSFFGGLTGTVEIDIKFDLKENQRYHKVRNGKEKAKLPAFFKNDDLSGSVTVSLKDSKKYEHLGIKCFLVGYLGTYAPTQKSTPTKIYPPSSTRSLKS